MFNKLLLSSVFIVLGYGFWQSTDFKTITAGVAIFLFGMISLEQGFKAFTGGRLEKILNRCTDKQWKSIGFGMLTTSIMQSSSLVSVITISFLSAGLLGLGSGIGIIFGANIGTTTGAWLVAGLGLKIKISAYAMPMLVFGVVFILQKSKYIKGIGYILTGLGFLFLGISYMKEGFDAFKDTLDLANYAIGGLKGLFIFSLIGVAATVIMQSSHATLVLIITALASSQITYENALALAIGANIGTTITAILGALSANIQGKRLAAAHLCFNFVTGFIAIVFIQQFITAVDWTSEYVGIANDNYTLKLAVFHTFFNVVGVLLMWPSINFLVRFLTAYLPGKEPSKEGALYLNNVNLDFPETTVEAISKETEHVYTIARQGICDGLSLKIEDIIGSTEPLAPIIKRSRHVIELDIDKFYEAKIKGLYSEIIEFISKASFTWELEQSETIHWLRSANHNIIESVKDMKHLRKNMARCITSRNLSRRDQYDSIRLMIANVIREIEKIRVQLTGNEFIDVLPVIDALKADVKKSERSLNQKISRLLNEQRISPYMASSLMNDIHYATHIADNLLAMANTIYVFKYTENSSIEKEVPQDSNEHDIIAKN